jgi:alpha-L-rhamnosidase
LEVAEGWYASRLEFDGGKRYLYGSQIAALAQLEIYGLDGQALSVVTDGS